MTLGAITPTSVAATGTITGSNLQRGTGTPEGAVTGVVGDLFERTDGGTGTTLYIKESGAGNTGWVAVAAGTATIGGSIANTQLAFGSGANTIQGSANWTISGTVMTFASGTRLVTGASASAQAGLNLPHGAAPSAPVNGDLWTETTGLYARINGATVGPYTSNTGTVTSVSLVTANGVSGSVATATIQAS